MTTEIWRVHFLWIFQITKITRAKLPIQNCLSGGFQERVGITDRNAEKPGIYAPFGTWHFSGNRFCNTFATLFFKNVFSGR